MTTAFAQLVVQKLFAMFAMFGVILFAGNSASTKKAERIRATRKKATNKKKKTARWRTDRTARKQPSVSFGESKSVDWKAAQSPLSLFQKNMLDKYRIGRDYPNAGRKGQWSMPD